MDFNIILAVAVAISTTAVLLGGLTIGALGLLSLFSRNHADHADYISDIEE
jgi:hypothetical protein